MSKIFLIFFSLVIFTQSCSTSNNKFSSKEISKIFNASYTKVWNATIEELLLYTLKSSNIDNGTIVTENIITNEKLNNFNNASFTVETYFYINITPISTNPHKTKIAVTKYSKLLNSNRVIGTDYIDEQILLYRVKRNLELERNKLGYY